jgi:hypothetical protein
MTRAIACLLGAIILCLPAFAQVPLPPGHWAAGELDGMARRGLVVGYPAGPLAAPADMTRHEAAALVMRAVRGVAAAFQQAGAALEQPAEGASPPQVRMEDLARLEKLIAEFRTELVSLGTDVAHLSRAVSDLRKQLQATQKQVLSVADEQKRHRLSGYVQFRLTYDQAEDARSEFSLRRARLRMSGLLGANAYAVELGADDSSSIDLKDAYVSRLVKGWQLRGGQFRLPFGIETAQDATEWLAPERSAVTDRLFPGQRDRGIALFSPLGPLQGALAVVNGSGIEGGEIDNRKDVVARVWHAGRRASAGISGYLGRWTGLRKTRLGLDLRFTHGRGAVQGEYVRGHGEYQIGGPLLDTDVEGWYAQLEWGLQGRPGGILFARRDAYDPDRDMPGDMLTRTMLGWAWQPDPATRLTAAAERKNDPTNGGDTNAFTLQWQLVY